MHSTGVSEQLGTRERTFISSEASGHLQNLGALWVVYGVIRLAMAICLVLYSGTATVMFGALLDRVPNPFFLMSAFHVMYAGMVVLAGVCGLLGLLAGAMLSSKRGRALALVASFLALSDVPLGTTLGIYTIIVLLR